MRTPNKTPKSDEGDERPQRGGAYAHGTTSGGSIVHELTPRQQHTEGLPNNKRATLTAGNNGLALQKNKTALTNDSAPDPKAGQGRKQQR